MKYGLFILVFLTACGDSGFGVNKGNGSNGLSPNTVVTGSNCGSLTIDLQKMEAIMVAADLAVAGSFVLDSSPADYCNINFNLTASAQTILNTQSIDQAYVSLCQPEMKAFEEAAGFAPAKEQLIQSSGTIVSTDPLVSDGYAYGVTIIYNTDFTFPTKVAFMKSPDINGNPVKSFQVVPKK